MACRVLWTQFNGSLELSFSVRPVPLSPQSPCERGVGFAKLVIYLHRLQRCCLDLCISFPWRKCTKSGKQCIAVCQSGVSKCIIGIFFYCLIEVFNAFPKSFPRSFIPSKESFEIRLICLGVGCVFFAEELPFFAGEL